MEHEIRVAASWWAHQLPMVKPLPADQVGAQPGETMADPLAVGLFERVRRKEVEAITPEVIAVFRVSLERILRESMVDYKGEPDPERYKGMGFGTDYGPDLELGSALDCAGLYRRSSTLLPMKTVMWMAPGFVKVSAGRGGETVDLYRDYGYSPEARQRRLKEIGLTDGAEVVETCNCGEIDCMNFDAGYPWCLGCGQHHRFEVSNSIYEQCPVEASIERMDRDEPIEAKEI